MLRKAINVISILIITIFVITNFGSVYSSFVVEGSVFNHVETSNTSEKNVVVLWNHTFGGSERDDCFSVIPTTDGGFLMAGSTLSFDDDDDGDGDYDMWLVKTNSSGIAKWDRTFGGNKSQVANSVIQTTDGGFLVAGYTTDTQTGARDIFIVKTNSYGQQQWNKTIGEKWGHDVANEVIATLDGGFLLVGWTNYFNNASNDMLLIKTNSDGSVQWNKTYGGSSEFDEASSVVQTADGGYILGGHTSSYGAESREMWLVKTSSSGTVQWNRTFGTANTDRAFSIIQLDDGGFLMGGIFSSRIGLVKTDSNGIRQWNKTYSLMNNSDAAYSVAQMSDGGYVVVGFTSYYGIRGDDDTWVLKVDTNGNLEWNKTLGGTGKEIGQSVVVLTNDDIIIGGTTDSYGAGGYDMWLVKVRLIDLDITTETTGTEVISNTTTNLTDSTGTTTPGFESLVFFSSLIFIYVVLKKRKK